jgi:RNA polymerase-binding protein DksA
MSEYEQVRDHLIELLEELDERLTRITDDVRHTENPIEKDFAEQITQNENNEVQDFLGNSARDEMARIKSAIASIDKGHYGTCQVCAEPIGAARLKAIPFATLCIKCASESTHEGR